MFRSLYPDRSASLLATSWRTGARGEVDAARRLALEILIEARAAGDDALAACAALQIAWFCFQTGDNEAGLDHAAAAGRHFATDGSPCGEAAAGALTAWLLLEVGLSEDASREAVQALDRLGPSCDPGVAALATNVLGCVFWSSQQLEQAASLCAEAIALAERAGDPVAMAWWRVNLAGARAHSGYRLLGEGRRAEALPELMAAVAINQEALALAESTGDLWCQHLTLCNAAEYLCAAGRTVEATLHLDRCDALPFTSARRSRIHYLFTRAEVLLAGGHTAEALPSCQEALRHASASGDVEGRMQSFKHLSAIHEQLGAYEEALGYFKQYFAAHQSVAADKVQRLARVAGIRYETRKLRELAEAAEAQVANLVRTAQSDPLTGLSNRRAFDAALAGLAQSQRPYALAIVDLDHFKRINDRFSHMVGDEVLKQVGAVLVRCCRPGDLAARLGGEEFALVFEGVDVVAAARQGEAVRQALMGVDWSRHHADLKVTASIGVAGSDEASAPAGVLALADRRLYQAKKQGRNRVVAAPARRGAGGAMRKDGAAPDAPLPPGRSRAGPR